MGRGLMEPNKAYCAPRAPQALSLGQSVIWHEHDHLELRHYPFPSFTDLHAFMQGRGVRTYNWVDWLLGGEPAAIAAIKTARATHGEALKLAADSPLDNDLQDKASQAWAVWTALEAKAYALKRAWHHHTWTAMYSVAQKRDAINDLILEAPPEVLLDWNALRRHLNDANLKNALRHRHPRDSTVGDRAVWHEVWQGLPESNLYQAIGLPVTEADALHETMSKIAPEYRRIIVAQAEHLSERKAAKALGVPRTTFQRQLARARTTAQPIFWSLYSARDAA
jgi:DNA-directed RNA polymerase specialized sigma24 family protein